MSTTPYLEIVTGAHAGSRVVVDRSPFRIGRGAAVDLRLDTPGNEGTVCILFEEQDGWYITSSSGEQISLNESPLQRRTRFVVGDTLFMSFGATLRFVSPFVSSVREESRVSVQLPPSLMDRDPGSYRAPDKHVASRGWDTLSQRLASGRAMLWIGLATIALVLAVTIAVVGVRQVRTATRSNDASEEPLSEADAELFDALLLTSYDHLERGATLLDAGASSDALAEFARAINNLETSRLRTNPFLRPRIEAMKAQIGGLYQSRQIKVPGSYANVRAPLELRPHSRVSQLQFAASIDQISRSFATEWRHAFVITGRDHAEHLSLYGPSSAIDVRTRNLTADEMRWLVAACKKAGLRVKDFSSDSLLQDQVTRALAANLKDRAGTGLHIHVDRYSDRRDRFTS